ncbi:MAG: hypothetical protein KC486_11230 [Myxococcales bacterium]|nr:hypothetical protein [Myxococcales bacterium]
MGSVEGGFAGVIPPQSDGVVVEYQVRAEVSDGMTITFPDNPADPWYERYFGPVTPIYCTGFENADELDGWTPFNEWAFGAPLGAGGDPGAAYEGAAVAGVDLGDMEDGLYDPTRVSRLRSPVIDVSGHDKVRLQFWRWLTVEDREFDSARIEVNGAIAWQNASKGLSPEQNNLHHIDREWVFRDIDITPGVKDGKVELTFILSADAGLDFGGWNLDSLCLVGAEAPPAPVCGDGNLDLGEQCDDGNTEPGDGCDPSCVIEGETTGGVGTTGGSTTGDGTTGDGSATTGAMIDDEAGGCACAAGDSDRGGALFGFALLCLAGIGRRRRRP